MSKVSYASVYVNNSCQLTESLPIVSKKFISMLKLLKPLKFIVPSIQLVSVSETKLLWLMIPAFWPIAPIKF